MIAPSQDRERLKRRNENRYRFLRGMYDATGGSSAAFVNMWELGGELGLSREDTNDAESYLQDEGLVKAMTLGGGISITHRGIQEVESSIQRPNRPTAHFSTEVINHYTTTYNGPVINQSGTHNVANVVHNVGVTGSQVAALVSEIRQLVAGLQPEQRQDALDMVQVIEAEAQSPAPRKGMLRTALKGLTELAKDAAALAVPLASLAQAIGPLLS
jgi:hypothetical protein